MRKTLSPKEAMKMAIDEAQKGWGHVKSNPLVGCVILDKENHLIASGYHPAYGKEHAEINAINMIKDKNLLDGATVYVTLEPCAHQGKTPSCAQTLSKLPLSKLVYGLVDPNPLVKGKGLAILEKAGIHTEKQEGLDEELEELSEIFLWNMRKKLPFVALKVATSLDGFIALSSGESRWITNEEARGYGHFLRAQYDAILVGSQTFLLDDPSLNVRHKSFPNHRNKVIILDSEGKSLEALTESKILDVHNPEDVFVVLPSSLEGLKSKLKVNVLFGSISEDGGFVLSQLLRNLYEKGITSIYVEGGAKTYSSFLRSGDVQRVYQFIAPCILGAKNTISWTKDLGIEEMAQKKSLKRVRHLSLGDNIFLTGQL